MSEHERDDAPQPDYPTRTFTGPSGRTWRVQVQMLAPMDTDTGRGPVTRAVLRFIARDLTLELHDWPADWETMPEEGLVNLARSAKTPSGLSHRPSRPTTGPTLRR